MGRKNSPKRKSIPVPYFIVEGYTEDNYIGLLRKTFKKPAKTKNAKGGSARSVLDTALKIINEEKGKGNYTSFIIWFDEDTYDTSVDEVLVNQARNDGADVYVSEPCVEHWLLAHFQTINLQSNNDCNAYLKNLATKNYLPKYEKQQDYPLDKYIALDKINIAKINYPKIGKLVTTYF